MGGHSQVAYKENDLVKEFNIPTILNYTQPSTSLSVVSKDITILDFFGTWCVPCVKALPHLSDLKNKFNGRVSIVLISTEEEQRLTKFIAARPGFAFPVVIDANQSISELFQPPSFPYTVVLNKDKKIIAIADAEAITEKLINEWLSGEEPEKIISSTEKSPAITTIMNSQQRSDNKLVALSQDFIYAAKTGDPVEAMLLQFKELSFDTLQNGLKNDDDKKAFWINAYNGFTQALLKKDPAAYKNRRKFFTSKQAEIAGKKFSLDNMEHGILRRSKIKWSLGHFGKLFPGKTEKALRVDSLDYRIHFALNCGAKSCPPIAFYDPSNISTQLDVASTAYLTGEVIYDKEKNTVGLPAIMGWFRRDFGNKKKMIRLLKDKGIVPEAAHPKIHFNKYDWDLHLNNFQN